jgi:hypothetical protein
VWVPVSQGLRGWNSDFDAQGTFWFESHGMFCYLERERCWRLLTKILVWKLERKIPLGRSC